MNALGLGPGVVRRGPGAFIRPELSGGVPRSGISGRL